MDVYCSSSTACTTRTTTGTKVITTSRWAGSSTTVPTAWDLAVIRTYNSLPGTAFAPAQVRHQIGCNSTCTLRPLSNAVFMAADECVVELCMPLACLAALCYCVVQLCRNGYGTPFWVPQTKHLFRGLQQRCLQWLHAVQVRNSTIVQPLTEREVLSQQLAQQIFMFVMRRQGWSPTWCCSFEPRLHEQ